MCTFSHFTASFNRLRSTQIRTSPEGLTTGTIGEHQSVGSMTCMSNMRCSSFSTCGCNGIGIRRGTEILYGTASSLSVILMGSHFTGSPMSENAFFSS